MKNKSILFVILLILAAAAHKGPALAQTPPQGGTPPQSGSQQPPQPPSQPQSQPQQPSSQQAPSQQQPPQQPPQPQPQQMTPQQQQQMQQQYQQQYQQQNPQNQQYQQGSQPQYQQPGTGQFQQNGQTPNQQNFQPNQGQQPQPQQMTPEQQKQYQQYQQMNPQQQQQMQEQYKKQFEQVQQQYQQYREQWKQQAAQNGFQITTPPNAFQQQGQQGQSPNQAAPQSGFALPSLNSFPTIQGQFFVGSANGAPNINLNDKNTNVILGSDNSLKAKRPDGTEVEINKEAFEKINAAIKLETGSEISQNGNAYVMKRGQFEMETKFPISFNVATRTFSVQTPQGTKEVGVLPDQAVERAIQSGVISNIAGVNTAQGGTSNAKIPMSEINNQPVYQIEGSNKKRVFGFFPVSISKTTFVSAENGNVVTTNQGIFSRFLDAISSK